jgi:hypothetical protein
VAGDSKAEATFRINIDGNASVATKEIATSARLAARGIEKYENEVKTLGADLRRLTGNSTEVTSAKAALRKRIDEAKVSASKLTAELTKQGTSYAAAAAAARKYGDGVGKLPNLRAAVGKLGGAAGGALAPVGKKLGATLAPLGKRLGTTFGPIAKRIGEAIAPAGGKLAKFGLGAKKALSTLGKAVAEDAGSVLPSLSSALGLVTSGAAAAALAVAAVGAAAVAAAVGIGAFGLASADAAAKMQRQREALLGNAQDAKAFGEQIAALSGKVPQGVEELNALALSLSKTRLTGKAMVSTFEAVSQATGAVDASAGAKIQELITRGQQSGRFFLGQLELQGTGLDFEDVAKEYAAGTKKSVAAARAELLRGEVPLEAAAEALAKATTKKFGALNIKNAFSLENAPKKLKEQLSLLSSGVDLSPITNALQGAFGQLAENAPLGRAVKAFMSTFGGALVDIAAKSIPVMVEGFTWLVVGAIRVATQFYELRNAIDDALTQGDWVGAGKAIIVGLVKGIKGAISFHNEALFGIGKTIKEAFTSDLKIQSPSKVFEGYGRNTVEGYAQGVEKGTQRATDAVGGMAKAPAAASASSGPISVEVHLHGAPTDSAKGMQSPEFLAALTRAIRDALTSKGLVAA